MGVHPVPASAWVRCRWPHRGRGNLLLTSWASRTRAVPLSAGPQEAWTIRGRVTDT
jgi:hypothetical protein